MRDEIVFKKEMLKKKYVKNCDCEKIARVEKMRKM